MKKIESQSILDFINIVPMQSPRRSALNEKEAIALYEIFKSERDQLGKMILPDHVDSMSVAALTTKGYLKNNPSRVAFGNKPIRTVDFSDKAKNLIRNIILYTEKSAFSKNMELDRNNFVRAISGLPILVQAGKEKTASISVKNNQQNWLTKAKKWN